jgi:hypothetical protein
MFQFGAANTSPVASASAVSSSGSALQDSFEKQGARPKETTKIKPAAEETRKSATKKKDTKDMDKIVAKTGLLLSPRSKRLQAVVGDLRTQLKAEKAKQKEIDALRAEADAKTKKADELHALARAKRLKADPIMDRAMAKYKKKQPNQDLLDVAGPLLLKADALFDDVDELLAEVKELKTKANKLRDELEAARKLRAKETGKA